MPGHASGYWQYSCPSRQCSVSAARRSIRRAPTSWVLATVAASHVAIYNWTFLLGQSLMPGINALAITTGMVPSAQRTGLPRRHRLIHEDTAGPPRGRASWPSGVAQEGYACGRNKGALSLPGNAEEEPRPPGDACTLERTVRRDLPELARRRAL